MIAIDKMKYFWGRMVVVCCIFTSCSLDIPYENQFSDPDAITTPATARELLASAYYQLPVSEFDLSVLADDFEPTYLISYNSNLSNLYTWQPQPIKDLALNLWQSYYAVIGVVNALLERTDNVAVSSEKERQELQSVISEAKILKAYCYFNLLRLFAPAYGDGADKEGIVLKDKLELEFLKRSSISECVTAIRNLLTDAIQFDDSSAEEYWLSQYGGYYLLAELELYAQNYSSAELYAKKVIEFKGGYDVLGADVYAGLFGNGTCAERVFSIYTSSKYYGDINYDAVKGDYMVVNEALAGLYSEGDIRYGETVYPFEMPGETAGEIIHAKFLGKYAKRTNWTGEEVQYINKFRVAGACFILAEAYCRDGNGHEPEAVEVLNDYLGRRGGELLEESLTGEALLKAILSEKWKEFAGEGERYFDLKRFRRDVLSDWNSEGTLTDKRIKADDYRWTFPIPSEEYLYNENMTQNEGWEKIEG